MGVFSGKPGYRCAFAALLLWLPLLAGCTLHRVEVGGSFTSYTRGWSVPIYGPDGGMGDNEPEAELGIVLGDRTRLAQVFRFSWGEGTIVNSPQHKITVYSLTWAARTGGTWARGWSWEAQGGVRLAWVSDLPGGGRAEVGPDVAVAVRRHITERLSIAFTAGLWWTPGGDLPRAAHPRIGLALGWDF